MLKKMLSPQTEQPFFWIIVILLAVIAVYNWIISLLALILSIGAYLLTRKNSNERNLAMQQLLDSISQGVDQASTYAVQNLPIGIAIVDMQGTICWANSVFRDWVGELDAEQQLKQILPNLNLDKFWGKFGSFFETMRERQYRVVYKYLQTEEASEDNYLILYFEDISETETQKLNCLQTVPAFCDIEIDNMEEVSKGLSAVQQATLWTNVNNCLLDELTALGGFVRSYGNAKYFACLTHKALQTLQADNFSFFEKIRKIHTVNRIPVTISMGIAAAPEERVVAGRADFNELAEKARAGLDLALGRGGDQAVVYEADGTPHFYGGKTRSVEKNTRVRARVVAQAVRELVDTSERVLIMGHEREDYDSIGAAVGVAHMARSLGKPVHIIVSKQTDAIQRLKEQISDRPEFKDLFISAETAESLCNAATLLFVVDTHRPYMTVAPNVLDLTERRVVIDHHRRSSDFIQKPLLTYLEASSSSTCELVTELLQYYQEEVELEKIEATALYAGIIVDTKNFAVQTGVRTFDAASYLRRSGADPEIVRALFSSDFESLKNRAKILSAAHISEGIALAICPPGVKNAMILAAQCADTLVNIEHVQAGFTFYELANDCIGVSARSKGDINVQLVMEALGGGGHRTVAGAQLKGKTIAGAQEEVVRAVRAQMKENHAKEIDKG